MDEPSGSPLAALTQQKPLGPEIPRRRRFRTKCFEHADRWFDRLVRLLEALYQAFWLGCLNPDDLNAITGQHFQQSRFYASIEHNQSGFFAWEKPLIERYFQPGTRLLVAAAGGGREVLALRKAGFQAEGFECSQPLVDAARKIFKEIGESNHVLYCPSDHVPEGTAIYHGLVVGWGGYTHIPTRARRIAFLQALRNRNLPRSHILLSFFTRGTDFWDDMIVHQTSRFFRFFVPGRKDPLQVGDRISFARYVHAFTRDELEEELRSAGLRVLEYHEVEQWGYAVGITE